MRAKADFGFGLASVALEGHVKDQRISRLVLEVAVIASFSCGIWPTGPSRSVAGNWSAPGERFTSYQLSLTQDGDTISGVACRSYMGLLVFAGAPVNGDYPRIRFTSGFNATFSARHEEDRDQIAGEYGPTR